MTEINTYIFPLKEVILKLYNKILFVVFFLIFTIYCFQCFKAIIKLSPRDW